MYCDFHVHIMFVSWFSNGEKAHGGEEHFEIARGWTQPPPCFLAHAFTMDKSPWVRNTLKLQKVGLNHHLVVWLMLLQWIKPMGGGGEGGGGGGGNNQKTKVVKK
jgi:hypothetical protein